MASLVELVERLRDEWRARNTTFVDLLIPGFDFEVELHERVLPPEVTELFLGPNLEAPERVNWRKEGF